MSRMVRDLIEIIIGQEIAGKDHGKPRLLHGDQRHRLDRLGTRGGENGRQTGPRHGQMIRGDNPSSGRASRPAGRSSIGC